MYRINRFFVSEITAGGNVLRNGFVPVLREDGQADHGVLFAANGTCKTTLLSFVLSVFCPARQRFVQHLQSGGDKTLEQYLIPGRPALVMLDLATTLQPTLFEAEPVDHLVLGQLLYRHRSAPDKTDRTFFIAQSADLFDELRQTWDALLGQEQPYRAVRDFMLPRIQQTTSQKEWSDKLEQLGLDPWLIDRQIDFARTEGGIKDAFKFRSEADFLSFFLGCVTDLDAAMTLRARIDQDLRKMQDRPRKLAQLKAARSMKEQIAEFDTIAAAWRMAGRAIETWQLKLGEATHLLQAADKVAAEEAGDLEPALADAETRLEAAVTGLETVRSNILAVQRVQLAREMAAKAEKLSATRGELERLQAENLAIQAADFMADIREIQAEAGNKAQALQQAGKEMAPMQRKVDGLAAQYHARIDAEREQIGATIDRLKERHVEAEARERAIRQRRTAALTQKASLDNALEGLSARIQEAEAARSALALDPGETPLDARHRLTQALGAVDTRITAVRGQLSALDEATRAESSRWRRLQTDYSRGETDLIQARQLADAEAAERDRLAADAQLVRVAGTAQVDVTSAELVSHLDGALARSQTKLAEVQREALKCEQTLEQLDRTETLAADDQTQRLIAHYHQAGIMPGDLKSYPEYLATLYDTPDQIARFIEGDPGRFTGIMAATDKVIEAVSSLPVPSWLHRPVVVSTPCPPEAVEPIAQTVVRPPSPEVYSKHHMAKVKATHRERLADLNRSIEAVRTVNRAMERASRELHAYREKYPDRAAVAALTERVETIERNLADLFQEIGDAEEAAQQLEERKGELEAQYRRLGDDAARLNQQVGQVNAWLGAYDALGEWRAEAEKKRLERTTLDKAIRTDEEALADIKDDVYRIREDLNVHKYQLKGLDDRAGDVQRPANLVLTAAEQDAALSMDLNTLKRLYEGAREDQRQMAHDLGIDHLQKELNVLKDKIARRESAFEAFGRAQRYDAKRAGVWAGRSVEERAEARQRLVDEVGDFRETGVRLETELAHQQEEIAKLEAVLAERAAGGMPPDLRDADMADKDPDVLLHRLNSDKLKLSGRQERLTARCRDLKEKQTMLEKWHQEIRLGLAENQAFAPVWDAESPRSDWPDLFADTTETTRMTAVNHLREALQRMAAAEREDRQAVETAQRKMRDAFDRFQIDLQSDAYRNDLPAVVDELRSFDAESLGAQARDLIQRCEDIARNFETDLEITQRFMDSLVDMLVQHSREYHQKLQAASQEVLPEDVFIYGGKTILRAGTRLDFTKHHDVFRQSVENWLYELMQQGRLPEVNPRMGNCLGAELLYQLLGAASGRQTFGIRLLKCDDTGSNYEPVGKDLGSGGEALTIAVLLYALLISMRKRRRNPSDDRIPAFLVLDNPLGVCNRSDFLDAQLKVARAMGLQCVYLTGINDRESLDLFELRVAIRKGEKKIAIDNTTYDCLEITELNVEKEHGPKAA